MGSFNISSKSEIIFQFRTFQKSGSMMNVDDGEVRKYRVTMTTM
jgi:hypothetical protein